MGGLSALLPASKFLECSLLWSRAKAIMVALLLTYFFFDLPLLMGGKVIYGNDNELFFSL